MSRFVTPHNKEKRIYKGTMPKTRRPKFATTKTIVSNIPEDLADGCYLLMGAVIKKAIEDAVCLSYYKKLIWNTAEISHNLKEYLHREVRAGKDAKNFITTKGLEDFIKMYELPLNLDFVRRKYLKYLERYNGKKFFITDKKQ